MSLNVARVLKPFLVLKVKSSIFNPSKSPGNIFSCVSIARFNFLKSAIITILADSRCKIGEIAFTT